MLIFLRSSEVAIDARLARYSRALTSRGVEHAAVFWQREVQAGLHPAFATIPYRAALGYRSRWKTALRLAGLNLFAFREIWRRRKTVTLIHAIDLDTAPAAWLARRLTGIPYIYDAYDHYPDSRGITGMARRIADWLDSIAMRDSALLLIADCCRLDQYKTVAAKHWEIIENVPDIPRVAMPQVAMPEVGKRSPLRLGYLGTLEARCRGLEDLLAVVEAMPQVELEIAGAGVLEDKVRQAARRCPRIRFHGPMSHVDGLAMLQTCHIVLGLYYACNPNHRYAAPNKYFEHLFLGRPMLTSLGTPPGEKVVREASGWAIADGAQPLRHLLDEVVADPRTIIRFGRNAAQCWSENYADYAEKIIQGRYVNLVRQIGKARSGPNPPGSKSQPRPRESL